MPAGEECLLPWPVAADGQGLLPGVAGEVPDPVAERFRVGASRGSASSWQPRMRVQATRGPQMFAARTRPTLGRQDLEERLRRPMALEVRTHWSRWWRGRGGARGVLGVVAAGDAADPGAGLCRCRRDARCANTAFEESSRTDLTTYLLQPEMAPSDNPSPRG